MPFNEKAVSPQNNPYCGNWLSQRWLNNPFGESPKLNEINKKDELWWNWTLIEIHNRKR